MNAIPTETLRLFFALWPDDLTRSSLLQLQTTLSGRLIPYSNLHLTLAFLGQQPASVLDTTKDILLRLSSEPVLLTFDRVGYFSRNRVAWAGMHAAPDGLLKLHQELSDAISYHGIETREQPVFKPHITLARDAAAPADIAFNPIRWRAAQIALVQSIPHSNGSTYQVLASRSLDEKIMAPDA